MKSITFFFNVIKLYILFFPIYINGKNSIGLNEKISSNYGKNSIGLNEKDNFIDYGIYCGYLHTSEYGIKPIDIADRYCQIHDICTSIGLFDCFCNEQLYYNFINYIPINNETKYEKDSILKALYTAIFMCPNYDKFDVSFRLGNYGIKGFNYIPLFYYEKNTYLNLENYNEFEIYKFDGYNEYIKFAYMIHDTYPNKNIYKPEVTSLISIKNDEIYVIYNNKSIYANVILKNISEEMNKKEIKKIISGYLDIINDYLNMIYIFLFIFILCIFAFFMFFLCYFVTVLFMFQKKYKKIQ
jgi:hypothetical protein